MKIRKTYIITIILVIFSFLLSYIIQYISKNKCKHLINTIHYKSCVRVNWELLDKNDFVDFLIIISHVYIILSIAKFWSDYFYSFKNKK